MIAPTKRERGERGEREESRVWLHVNTPFVSEDILAEEPYTYDLDFAQCRREEQMLREMMPFSFSQSSHLPCGRMLSRDPITGTIPNWSDWVPGNIRGS